MISFRSLSCDAVMDHRCFFQIISKIHVAKSTFDENVSKVQKAMAIIDQTFSSLFQFIFLQKSPRKSCFWTSEMSWAFNLRVFFNDRYFKAISQMIGTYNSDSRYVIIIKFKIILSRVIPLIIIFEIFYRVRFLPKKQLFKILSQ